MGPRRECGGVGCRPGVVLGGGGWLHGGCGGLGDSFFGVGVDKAFVILWIIGGWIS